MFYAFALVAYLITTWICIALMVGHFDPALWEETTKVVWAIGSIILAHIADAERSKE